MFVKSSLEVPFGVGAVREELVGSLESWLESLMADARSEREHLLAQVGLTVASSPHPLQLDVEEARIEDRMVALPFRVWAEEWDGRWPCFHSVLSAAWFGDERTQLSLEARYVPPEDLPRSGQTLLHRVVESVNRHILEDLGSRLERRLAVSGATVR
ncbi:MAG TPA: hypothetical protein VFA92_01180 [Candidatus Binatia bacterium]|nr:hypothetical protein [Candidatus Binatia bacterium]